MPIVHNWESTRHDAKDFIVVVYDGGGDVVPLTGVQEITFAASPLIDGTFDPTPVLVKKLTDGAAALEVTDEDGGEFTVHIEKDDTDSMDGDYHYECEVIDVNGRPATVTVGEWSLALDLVLNP